MKPSNNFDKNIKKSIKQTTNKIKSIQAKIIQHDDKSKQLREEKYHLEKYLSTIQ